MNDLPFLIIFLLAVAFLFRVDFIFYIVYVTAGIYLWSQWRSPRVLDKLRLQRNFRDHAFLGEPVSVHLRIDNNSWLPVPWLQLYDSVPASLRMDEMQQTALSLRGQSGAEISYQVRSLRRGYFRLGPLLLEAGDLFGFTEQRRRFPASYLTVYPRILPLVQLGLPSRLPFGVLASRQRLFEDPARPIGVRDYQSGDSLRRINWKVSAHAQKLLVKHFQPAMSLDTMILLNMNQAEYERRHRYDRPDWAVTVAASLAAHLVTQRQAVGLASNGIDPLFQRKGAGREAPAFDQETGRLQMPAGPVEGQPKGEGSGQAVAFMPASIPPRPGRPHLMKVLEILARIEAGLTLPFTHMAQEACLNLSWGTTIIAITPRGDELTCQTLHRLLRAGYNPVLIAIEPNADFSRARERAHRLGFAAYHVSEQEDLRF